MHQGGCIVKVRAYLLEPRPFLLIFAMDIFRCFVADICGDDDISELFL